MNLTPRASNVQHTLVLALCSALLLIAGCSNGGGGGGGGAPAVTPVAPSGLTYPAPGPIFQNVAMTALSPTLAGGTTVSYSVTPALPTGISLNSTTGVISGTPTVVSALTTYTITASNSAGNTTFDLDLEVMAVPLAGLTYPAPGAIFENVAMTALAPTLTAGTPDSFAVAPAFPTGITLDPVTGVISGTPTAISALTTYTVTATNSVGSTTFDLDLEVMTVSLAGLAYPPPGVLFENIAMTPLAPSLTSGTPDSFAVAPAFPTGITLDPVTGVISGTPLGAAALTTYTVTATNAAGSTSVGIDLEVIAVVIPDVEFAAAISTSPENSASVMVVVSLSSATINDVTVPFTVSGTASAGFDFTTPVSPIVITAGQTTGTIDILLIDDLIAEPAETIELTLGTPTNGTLGTITIHTLTLQDDEGSPTVNFAMSASSVVEGAGSADVEVTLTPATTVSITATLEVFTPLTTADATDFQITNFDVTFAPGDTSQNLTVTILDDSLFEGDEIVALNIGAVTAGADVGVIDITELTISEDDPEPTAEFATTSFSILESDLPVDLIVNLSDISSVDANLFVGVTGTADAADFTITASPLVIPAGSASGTITVTPINDGVMEPAETIIVTLTAGSGVVVGPNDQATINLSDALTAPCNLTYSTLDAVYGPMVAITPNTPSFQCGVPTTYDVLPPLPSGLSLNTTTGEITGTPTTEQDAESYTITASNGAGSTVETISIRVDQIYFLTASDAVASYDPAVGNATFNVSVTLEEMPSGSPAGFQEVDGYSFGLALDPSQLVVDSTAEGADSLLLNSGGGADFFNVNLEPEGVTVAVVVSFPQSDSLIADMPREIFSMQISSVPSFLIGNNTGATVTIPFVDTIGFPPVAILIVDSMDSVPILGNSTVQFVP